MKSLSLALTLLASSAAQEVCLPKARSIKVNAFANSPVAMFELLAMDENNVINWASPLVNPNAVATQSSQFKGFKAGNAIDMDYETFSHTKFNTGNQEWWQVDLGESHIIGEIHIKNRWCRNQNDWRGCLCKLSNSVVQLYDENGTFITQYDLGDTCGQTDLTIKFTPDAAFCEGEVISPAEVLDAGVCQDDQTFATEPDGYTCNFIAAFDDVQKQISCDGVSGVDYVNPATGDLYQTRHFCQVTCGECVPEVESSNPPVIPGGPEPTYYPTYLPSAQPVGNMLASEPGVIGVETSNPPVIPGVPEPTYSPTYLPSAQPVGNMFVADPGVLGVETSNPPVTASNPPVVPGVPEPTYSPTYLPSAQPVGAVLFTGVCQDDQTYLTDPFDYSCQEVDGFEDDVKQIVCDRPSGLDEVDPATGNVYQTRHYCPSACGDCRQPDWFPEVADSGLPEATVPGLPEPTYSPTYLPSAQPVASATIENDKLFGHAYSAGDVCEDDVGFVSDKGITCKSFVYAETVHCRSPTGQVDEQFEALRYSDFCPKTCGMCVDVSAASSVEDQSNAKGVAIGVGLSVSALFVMLVAWMCCRGNYTGKQNDLVAPRSEFRDDATAEYKDDVGLKKPGEENTVEEKIAESVGEKVPETEIV